MRVKKSDLNNSSNNKKFVYANTDLIAEYDNSGNVTDEYVYLNGAVIGLIRNNNLYYVYSDYLGVPRTITNTNNNVKWYWESVEPFGNSQPVEINNFKYNPRLVGQYYDEESRLNYNYYRDYNSKLGRYIESDPIGLNGGINTYSYVGGNGLSFVDKFGLDIVNWLKWHGLANLPLFFVKDTPNVLRIVSHGNAYFLNNKDVDTVVKIINKEKYIEKRKSLNKPIYIYLDACLSANVDFAKDLSSSLFKEHKVPVFVMGANNSLEYFWFSEEKTFKDEKGNKKRNQFKLYKNGTKIIVTDSYDVIYQMSED